MFNEFNCFKRFTKKKNIELLEFTGDIKELLLINKEDLENDKEFTEDFCFSVNNFCQKKNCLFCQNDFIQNNNELFYNIEILIS